MAIATVSAVPARADVAVIDDLDVAFDDEAAANLHSRCSGGSFQFCIIRSLSDSCFGRFVHSPVWIVAVLSVVLVFEDLCTARYGSWSL